MNVRTYTLDMSVELFICAMGSSGTPPQIDIKFHTFLRTVQIVNKNLENIEVTLKSDEPVIMERVLYACENLKSVKITAKPSSCQEMLSSCASLRTIDLSGLNTSDCDSFVHMLSNCKSAQNFTLGEGFKVALHETSYYYTPVPNVKNMFENYGDNIDECIIKCTEETEEVLKTIIEDSLLPISKIVFQRL